MDDKEFRKLRREDLIEIIYQYQRREQRLTQENELLKCQLKDRTIQIAEAGSIAQAALALNDVFKAAQKAADQYVLSVKAMAEQPQPVPAQSAPIPTAQPAEPPAAAAKPAAVPAEENPQLKAAPADPALTAAMAAVEAPWNQPEKRKPEKPQEARQPAPGGMKAPQTPQVQQPQAAARPQAPAAQRPQQPAVQKPQTPQAQQPAGADHPQRRKNPGQKRGNMAPQAPNGRPAPGPQGQPPRQQPPRKQEPDTDDFIASLKDYLGM